MTQIKVTQKDEELIFSLLSEKLDEITPSNKFRNQMLSNLTKGKKPKRKWWPVFTRHLRLYTVSLVLVIFAGTTYYSYVSPTVNSQSFLYPLKRFTENVEYSLTFKQESKAYKQIKFANKRLDELSILEKQGIQDSNTFSEIENNLKAAQEISNTIQDKNTQSEIDEVINEFIEQSKPSVEPVIEPEENPEQETKEVEESEPTNQKPSPKPNATEIFTPKTPLPEPEPSCSSTCAAGTASCSGNAVRTCVDTNGDGCYEWTVSACAANNICISGECVPPLPEGIDPDDFEQIL